MHRKLILNVLVAFALAAPAASARWSAFGTLEPDTPYDVSSGFMWQDADTSANPNDQQIYFNAFPTEYGSGTNLNSATTGSRVETVGGQY